MGLIEQEIMELRQMSKELREGKLSPEQASIQIGFYNQTSKRVSQLIQIAIMQTKEGKGGKATKRLIAANVLSDSSAIPVPTVEKEVVKCPEQGGALITREDCLEYSGDISHIDVCQQCEQFEITRKVCFNQKNGGH